MSSLTKKMEYLFKKIKSGRKISCIPPKAYAKRFVQFMHSIINWFNSSSLTCNTQELLLSSTPDIAISLCFPSSLRFLSSQHSTMKVQLSFKGSGDPPLSFFAFHSHSALNWYPLPLTSSTVTLPHTPFFKAGLHLVLVFSTSELLYTI